jgi:uncharacterized protein (DUF697 family)
MGEKGHSVVPYSFRVLCKLVGEGLGGAIMMTVVKCIGFFVLVTVVWKGDNGEISEGHDILQLK